MVEKGPTNLGNALSPPIWAMPVKNTVFLLEGVPLPLPLKQALTSTRGYSLPNFLKYYQYPTRIFLLPDRVEGSEQHPLCPNIYQS